MNRLSKPRIDRGRALHWPAVQQWSFAWLAERVPDVDVEFVMGNRELLQTQFTKGSLRAYLGELDSLTSPSLALPYLKEFDLLEALPFLRGDLQHRELFPRRVLYSFQSWIGPAHARTGLHRDYLDNVAVQVIGHKRFRLLAPGTVERFGAVSSKYDSWATLSRLDAETVLARSVGEDESFVVDLAPGDILYIPAGWWHEVCNLSPSLLIGGFHGPPMQVLRLWVWVKARDAAHRLGWLGSGDCTCHPRRLGILTP